LQIDDEIEPGCPLTGKLTGFSKSTLKGTSRQHARYQSVDTPETYRKRADDADRAAETARDLEAKRILRATAQRWRQLAELAESGGNN
jgi:hypothetical protein